MKVKLKLYFKWGIEFEKEPYVVPLRDSSMVTYASREELTEAIQAKYPPKEKKDDDDTIPDGSICVEEEMAMQNSPKLNTKPHKPEVRMDLKISRSTVKRAVEDLKRCGYITVERRYRKNGGNSSLLFVLKDFSKRRTPKG